MANGSDDVDVIAEILIEIILGALEVGFASKNSNNKGNTFYTLKRKEHKYFLLVAVLLYIFYEDDLNLSVSEKRRVRRHIRLSSIVTHRKTRKDLRRMVKHEVKMEDLKAIVSEYKLTKDDINDTFNLINKQMLKRDKEFRYSRLLRSTQSKLIID